MTPKEARRRFLLELLLCASCLALFLLAAGISVRESLIYGGLFVLGATFLVLILIAACVLRMESNIPQGAQFESSDGIWTDSTFELKGYGFDFVLYEFEAYKLKHNKPDVTLVRVSPEPEWRLFHSRRKRSDPKWKVPFQRPSGHATPMKLNISEQESEEVRRRAESALEYWQKL